MVAKSSWKHIFSNALAAQEPRISFLAHGHHLWPDAALEGHIAAWHAGLELAGKKWDMVLGPVWAEAQRHVASELNLPDPRTIVFAGNAHDLLVRVVSAIHRKPARVLASSHEFLSFMRQARRWHEVGDIILETAAPDRMLEVAQTGQFDLIYISQIFYDSGLESCWREIAHLAGRDGPWVIVDGYHGFMALPTDFSQFADKAFYLAGGYKYAMSGEGVGFLHAPADFALSPSITGWFAHGDDNDYRGKLAVGFPCDARRLIGSTFDPSGLYRFNSVRRMLAQHGIDTGVMARHAHRLKLELVRANGVPGRELLNPPGELPTARFLSFQGQQCLSIAARLRDEGIDVDARGNLMRIGLSIYHDSDDIEQLTSALAR